MKPRNTVVSSQASWVVRNNCIELALTQLGGHMAPVTFYRNTPRPVQPYHLSPWQNENLKIDEPVLKPLRGDFFCLPFGANATALRGQTHRVHGESAGSQWHFDRATANGPANALTFSMKYKACPGKVVKTLTLVDDQNVVYCQHVLEGFSGKMPAGHHACLAVPEQPASMLVSTSPFVLGMTCPTPFGDPGAGEYQSLAIGAKFKDLQKVPVAWAGAKLADCATYPSRKGFDDVLSVFTTASADPAWTVAVNVRDGYLWFALKDPRVLPTTVFWLSNSGRHGAPWLGRNRCLGLEDSCGYFAEGLADSARANLLTKAGIKTALTLSPTKPTAVNHIQGVSTIPAGFARVKTATFEPGAVTFIDTAGLSVTAQVNWDFLTTGDPAVEA